MRLLQQSVWWILPYVLLMVLIVFAMMEFTISLLVKRPRVRRQPLSRDELLQQLLALNEGHRPYRLATRKDSDLELHWDVVDPTWRQNYARVRLSTVYHARLLLDEEHHELRIFEILRSSGFFFGFDGWVPRINPYFHLQSGFINGAWSGRAYGILPGFPPRIGAVYDYALDTVQPKQEISEIAGHGGWTFRPVLWLFQVTHAGHAFWGKLAPGPFRYWPARRLWGLLYPASFFLGMGWLVAIIWPLDTHNLLMVLGISAIWWGIWGFLTWTLLGFPAFWRRRSKSPRHR